MHKISVYDADSFQANILVVDGDRIGSGATAEIYKVKFAGEVYAAKVYNTLNEERAKKIRAMILNTPLNIYRNEGRNRYIRYAWPQYELRDDKGELVGFLMPYADKLTTNSLDGYFDPVLVKRLDTDLEKALPFKIEIALSLTELFKDLHQKGHFFVDVKPQNIRVYKRYHHVLLLDCDGFSICDSDCQYPADLVSSDYISPESLRAKTPPNKLGKQQDLYALAVLIFQLFNNSTHPFQGVALNQFFKGSTNDDAAAAWLYPYGITPNPNVSPREQSLHVHWPIGIRRLFDRAFTSTSRPEADEWAKEFEKILKENALSKCKKYPNSAEHIHFSGLPCMACSRKSMPRSDDQASNTTKSAESDGLTSAGKRNLKPSSVGSASYNTQAASTQAPSARQSQYPQNPATTTSSKTPFGVLFMTALVVGLPLLLWATFSDRPKVSSGTYGSANQSREIAVPNTPPVMPASDPILEFKAPAVPLPESPAPAQDRTPLPSEPLPLVQVKPSACSLEVASYQMCQELYSGVSPCSDSYYDLLKLKGAIPEGCRDLPAVLSSTSKSRVCLVACRSKLK